MKIKYMGNDILSKRFHMDPHCKLYIKIFYTWYCKLFKIYHPYIESAMLYFQMIPDYAKNTLKHNIIPIILCILTAHAQHLLTYNPCGL